MQSISKFKYFLYYIFGSSKDNYINSSKLDSALLELQTELNLPDWLSSIITVIKRGYTVQNQLAACDLDERTYLNLYRPLPNYSEFIIHEWVEMDSDHVLNKIGISLEEADLIKERLLEFYNS